MTDQEPVQSEKPDKVGTLPKGGGLGYSEIYEHKPVVPEKSPLSPALTAVIGLVVGAAVAGGVLFALNRDDPAASQAVSSASASAAAAPSASASAAPELSPLQKVALGDPDALKEFEGRDRTKRSAEETLAVARGRDATLREDIAEMKRKIGLVPAFARKPETVTKVRAYARDRAVAIDILEMLASLEGDAGPDLLYKIWRDRRVKAKETKQLAEELLYSSDVRPKASKALAVALDLRGAEACEDVQKILERAKEHGDKRAEFAMGRFWMKRGCGDNKTLDCWACLRGDDLLKDAAAEARKRPAPL